MRGHRRALIAVAAGLALFDALSARSAWAKGGFLGLKRGFELARPPIYGIFRPVLSAAGLAALAVGAAAALGARAVWRRGRVRPGPFLAAAVPSMAAVAVAVAFSDGRTSEALRTVRDVFVARDLGSVQELGVAGAVRAYSDLAPGFASIHSVTHPPGRLVFLNALHSLLPPAGVAIVLVMLSALVLVPTWFIARRVAGERAAVPAVLLLAAAPGPLLFGFASVEAVESMIFATAAALLLSGGVWDEGRPRFAYAGGFVLGIASFLTFAVAFIAAFAVLLAFASRPWRDAVRALMTAAAGGLTALLVLRVAFGYDLFAAFRGSRTALHAITMLRPSFYQLGARPYLYWLAGGPAAWLTFAGVPIAGLALRELLTERPRYLVALLVPVACFYALPASVTFILPGELERTVLYAYPFAAIAAAAALVRWRPRSELVGALVGASILQALVLEALFFIFW